MPPLARGRSVALDAAQANYLVNVLRLKAGADVLVFNGRDGEWRAQLAAAGKKSVQLESSSGRAQQTAPGDLHYLFSPLKHARLDYMVQKAVEMGVSRLQPVMMRHTQAERVNLDAHARERHRGGRAMRHPQHSGDRRSRSKLDAHRARAGCPTGCWCSATRTPT